MRIVILGAGVIGVTTAYYLAKAGHEVVVIDRRRNVALETSFANAGEVSPGYASPWASPGLVLKAIKWFFMQHSPLILRPRLDADMLRFIVGLIHNCTPEHYAKNKARMVRLAEYSRDQLIALRQSTGISYDHRTQGTLQVFRTQASMDGAGKDVEVLRTFGVPFEILDKSGCLRVEPGLRFARGAIFGGLRLPNDETGDCFLFTNSLAKLAEGLGVLFQFDNNIVALSRKGNRIDSVLTDRGLLTADAFVVALGSYSAGLVQPLGLKLPIYPVKGYSITVPIVNPERAPESTLMDEKHKIAITRLGERIRVGGMAEIGGYGVKLTDRRRRTLEHSLEDLFPGAGDLNRETFWSGLRPMTPDGTPVVGRTPIENLFINSGHGTLGWTMACGSARVTSDLIAGATSEIETADLSLARYYQGRESAPLPLPSH
jgi:D-amino-acid dehydrogenase